MDIEILCLYNNRILLLGLCAQRRTGFSTRKHRGVSTPLVDDDNVVTTGITLCKPVVLFSIKTGILYFYSFKTTFRKRFGARVQ